MKNKKHFTLEMNTEGSSETSVAAYQTTRFHSLEDHNLHLHFCHKKSLKTLSGYWDANANVAVSINPTDQSDGC